MAREERKDFNAMLRRNNGMPKLQIVTDEDTIRKYGGTRMYFAPPMAYDQLMKQVPAGKVITVGTLRDYLARQAGADFTDPMTAGIFVSIAAWASEQRQEDQTPLLAHAEGQGRAESQVSRRCRGTEEEAGSRGAPGGAAGAEQAPLLCGAL